MVDYDEIRSGRRRDWWKRRAEERERAKGKVPPLEEMSRLIHDAEKEEAPRKRFRKHPRREETPPDDVGLPGPPPDPSLLESDKPDTESAPPKKRPSRTRFERERQADREEWSRTKRQLMVLGAIVAAVLLTLFIISAVWRALAGGREAVEMKDYMKRAAKGEYIDDISDPIRALATYRSAWIRGDMRLVWEITTPAVKKDILAVRSERQHILDQLHQYSSGANKEWVNLLRDLNDPKYLRRPSKPYSRGEVAVFLTQPHAPERGNRPATRYVIVFVYNHGDWEYFEGVPGDTWESDWDTIYDAKPGASLEYSR